MSSLLFRHEKSEAACAASLGEKNRQECLDHFELEGDVVFFLEVVGRCCGSTLRWAGALLRRTGFLLRTFRVVATATGTTTGSATEKLKNFADHFDLSALFASFFVVPRVHLQAAFDVSRAAFGEVLLCDLSLPAPKSDLHKGNIFLFLALVIVPHAFDRKGNLRDGSAFRSVAQFGISGEISDEHDFVEVGHSEKKEVEGEGEEQAGMPVSP